MPHADILCPQAIPHIIPTSSCQPGGSEDWRGRGAGAGRDLRLRGAGVAPASSEPLVLGARAVYRDADSSPRLG